MIEESSLSDAVKGALSEVFRRGSAQPATGRSRRMVIGSHGAYRSYPTHEPGAAHARRRSRDPRPHHRLAAAAQGARRDPDARRHVTTSRRSASASGRTTRATPASRCAADTRRAARADPRRHPRPRGRPRRTPQDCASRRRPTWTGPSPRASTAPPTTAPRSGSAANGSTSRTRRWTAASWSIRRAAPARCVPMTDVRTGDRIVVGRQGLRVFPAERQRAARTCSSSWPARCRARSPRA